VLEALEREWIEKFPNRNLLNQRKRSPWYSLRPPRIRAIEEYCRGHVFNVDGHRGVHRVIGWDHYIVMVYTGGGDEPLTLGEELPGGVGRGFSDFTAAVEAKDLVWENVRRQNERYEQARLRWQAERIASLQPTPPKLGR
jgi:hypothetical protein